MADSGSGQAYKLIPRVREKFRVAPAATFAATLRPCTGTAPTPGWWDVPLPDAVADTALVYNALHCFRDPEAALDEVLRCLKPGGQVLGSMLVRGAASRVDRLIEVDLARGGTTMGPGGTARDLRRWLDSRFVAVELTSEGVLAVFGGLRSTGPE